jgi:DNA-binding CsgD family transcriptional regulator
VLLGRDREVHAIERLIRDAAAGSSGVLAFVGEAGIGKSSLLEWACANAVGMDVLRARGVQSEAHIPFAGLFELLRPALGALGRLPAPQAAALEGALALRPAQAADRFAVGAATLSLLAESAPVLVLVDDAHWLDGSTADALRFALRRLVADPIAVILTVREGEPSLLDGADLPRRRLAGLDLEASAELLRSRAPGTSADAAARLHRDTGGNPLALLELAHEHLDEIPLDTPVAAVPGVSAAYLQRASALPERTRAALVLAAASDRGEMAVLARAGLDIADLAPAEEQGLVSIRDAHLEFRHPLARSAIYGGAAPEDRRGAHRALAGALPDLEADRRAWHLALAAAGPDEVASSALEQAGARARERSAYDVASHALARAAQLAPTEDRRARLTLAGADAAWLAGLVDRAVALLGEADGGAQAQHLLGHITLRRGSLARGRALLHSAAERAEPEAAIVMLAEAAEAAFYAGDVAGMRADGERANRLAAGTQDARATFLARIAFGMGRILAGEAEEGAELTREAVRMAEREDELTADVRLLAWVALGPLWLREAGTGDGLVDRALSIARARAAAGTLPQLLTYVGIGQAASGRLIEGGATFDEAVRLARETGQRTILAGALARLAWVEARRGRAEAARRHAGEALEIARELGAHLFEFWALLALGELELIRGDVGAAVAAYDELEAAFAHSRFADADLSPAPERVELLLRSGRREQAAAAAEPFARAAAAKGQPWAMARAARCRALLAGDDELEAHFGEALALHERTPDVFEAARTRLAYGARLRRAGRRIVAREQLRAAHEAFEDLGAAPWAELARTELAATGETARRRDPSTLDELTPQELKVSLLLAEGRTTREAAAALFLSPKTVEYHLRNAYRKLGIRSREELAASLAAAPRG